MTLQQGSVAHFCLTLCQHREVHHWRYTTQRHHQPVEANPSSQLLRLSQHALIWDCSKSHFWKAMLFAHNDLLLLTDNILFLLTDKKLAKAPSREIKLYEIW